MRALLIYVLLAVPVAAQERLRTHKIRSEHLGGAETSIHLLLPSNLEKGVRYPVLYILPVVDGDANWGQPFAIAQEEDFADKYGVICAMATYPRGTLYCNHPTKRNQQDEDYFVKDVVPFVDKHYPTIAEARGRLGRRLRGRACRGWAGWREAGGRPGR